jgi:hypothetical protein
MKFTVWSLVSTLDPYQPSSFAVGLDMGVSDEVIRHCELIPIELIWAQVKGFVAKYNTTFRIKDA